MSIRTKGKTELPHMTYTSITQFSRVYIFLWSCMTMTYPILIPRTRCFSSVKYLRNKKRFPSFHGVMETRVEVGRNENQWENEPVGRVFPHYFEFLPTSTSVSITPWEQGKRFLIPLLNRLRKIPAIEFLCLHRVMWTWVFEDFNQSERALFKGYLIKSISLFQSH